GPRGGPRHRRRQGLRPAHRGRRGPGAPDPRGRDRRRSRGGGAKARGAESDGVGAGVASTRARRGGRRPARPQIGRGPRSQALRRSGALPPKRLEPPPEEARLTGARHSRQRDAAAIRHHYDLSNDFYRIVLGPTLTYSCAYFASPDASLEDAQTDKNELICRKLRLQPGERVLDEGCGWGTLAIHAAAHHGARGVGVTLVPRQGELHEVGAVVSTMQRSGFEVRDVESLREHYALTLRRWVGNLEANAKEATALVGEGRYRVWRLYMAASARMFEAGRLQVHQALA